MRSRLVEELDDDPVGYHIIVDHIIGAHQYDLILLKNDAAVSIDLKGYGGKIVGKENGPWSVSTADGRNVTMEQDKNPFIQAREQRYNLMNYLNSHLPRLSKRFQNAKINRIGAMICFEGGSSYDYTQIEYKKCPWFGVVNEDELAESLKRTSSGEFTLRDSEVESLLQEMGVRRFDDDKGEAIADDTPHLAHLGGGENVFTIRRKDLDATVECSESEVDAPNRKLKKEIPPNLVGIHVETALEALKEFRVPKNRESRRWVLRRGTREYPPKFIISVANIAANNCLLDSGRFTASMANRRLTQLGYTVVDKETGDPWSR